MKHILLKTGRYLVAGIFSLYLGQASAQSFASLQAIHNSADTSLATVDVWVFFDGVDQQFLDDFNFREATAFQTVFAETPITIALAPANSTSIADTIPGTSFVTTLAANGKYVIMSQGNLGSGYAANPSGNSNSFGYLLISNALTEAGDTSTVSVSVVHGGTDAPNIDIYAAGAPVALVSDLSFGESTPYANLTPISLRLNLTQSDSDEVILSYAADLTDLGGLAGVIFASGYLTPGSNNGGEAFGLFMALADGTVGALDNVTSVKKLVSQKATVYPNPSNGEINMTWTSATEGMAQLKVMGLDGKLVYQSSINEQAGNNHLNVNFPKLNNGVYIIMVEGQSGIHTAKIQIAD